MSDLAGFKLPPEANAIVLRIELLLKDAQPMLKVEADATAADYYTLQATEDRYLPDTLKAYQDARKGGGTPEDDEKLIAQLKLLLKATESAFSNLKKAQTFNLDANLHFLQERFKDIVGAPEPDDIPQYVVDENDTSVTLARMLLLDRDETKPIDPYDVLEKVGVKLGFSFPGLTKVHRGLWGKIQSIQLEVPVSKTETFVYALEIPKGYIVPTVTRWVRGIENRSITTTLEKWMNNLRQDISNYTQMAAPDVLKRVFR